MQILLAIRIAPESVRSVRRNIHLLPRLKFALFAVNKVAKRAFFDIESLGLVKMNVVWWRGGGLTAYTRMRVSSTEDLTRSERVFGRGDVVGLERPIEEVPGSVRVYLWSYDGHFEEYPIRDKWLWEVLLAEVWFAASGREEGMMVEGRL